jgi:hypothetical protein
MRNLFKLIALAASAAATNAHAVIITFEPDDFAAGTDVSGVNPYVSLQTFRNHQDTSYTPTFAPVYIAECATAGPNCYSTTGVRTFGDGYGGFDRWGAMGGSLGSASGCFSNLRVGTAGVNCLDTFNAMLMSFADPTDFVEISGAYWAQDETYLYGFDDNFNLLGSMSRTGDWGRCQGPVAYTDYCLVTTSLSSSSGGIRYVIAGGWSNGTSLDNLRFNSSVPEPGTFPLLALGMMLTLFARRRTRGNTGLSQPLE